MLTSNNIMIIGVGLHAKRIYIPILFKHMNTMPFCLKLGVDFRSKKNNIEDYLSSNNFNVEMFYIEDYDNSQELSKENKDLLSNIARKNNITGVIISTEPLAHKSYALWAISQGLNILMDKPISTKINIGHNIKQADGIYGDYKEILKAYLKLQKKKKQSFL